MTSVEYAFLVGRAIEIIKESLRPVRDRAPGWSDRAQLWLKDAAALNERAREGGAK